MLERLLSLCTSLGQKKLDRLLVLNNNSGVELKWKGYKVRILLLMILTLRVIPRTSELTFISLCGIFTGRFCSSLTRVVKYFKLGNTVLLQLLAPLAVLL